MPMRRLLLPLFWLLELPLAAAAALLLALWIWSGTEGSLASALNQVRPFLPPGQTLELQEVSGTLRRGGRIGLLRWQDGALALQARQVRFAWQPLQLLQRRLRFESVQVDEIMLDDRRAASDPTPLQDIAPALDVELPFVVERVLPQGAAGLDVRALAGHYRYDQGRHQLALERVQLAGGRYKVQATLQGRAPMTLDLQLEGTVQAPIGDGRQVALDASATLRGTLAGSAASVDLLAQLQPAPTRASAGTGRAMRATVSGRISPWAGQPVQQAQASFNQLNLAALWPQAPQTLLTGNAVVRPRTGGWLAQLNLVNRNAGPWDTGRLPLDSAKAQVDFSAGRWTVQSLNAEAAGGRIRFQGALADAGAVTAVSGWQGQAQLQGVNPALLHSALEPMRLDGDLQARAEGDAVVFEAALKPSAGPNPVSLLRSLRLQEASARGRWADGWLRVQEFRLQTPDARAEGQFDLQPASRNTRAELRLTVPGALARLSGQFGPRSGDGTLALQLSDAQAALRWTARLPRMPAALAGAAAQGQGELALRWSGGWDGLLDGQGQEPSLHAQLNIPRLTLALGGQAPDQALRLDAFSAELDGALSALSLRTEGTVARAGQQARIRGEAQAGRGRPGAWQATVTRLSLQLQDRQIPGPWSVDLTRPLVLDWTSASAGQPDTGALRAGAAEAALTGPLPGTASLAWQPVLWKAGSLVTQGAVRGLPMAWMALLGSADLAAMGLVGDLVFDADWDASFGESARLHATMTRRSGDIQVRPEGAPDSAAAGTSIHAGVRAAALAIDVQDDTVRAGVRWDSERAGNAQAEFSTRITRSAHGWSWSADSPLNATVRARMPQVGVWSILAPPGWRVRGTVDANLALSGTRRAPHWSGSLRADDLALRSVVNGIEFGGGQLRATLMGQQLDIDAFSLRGAGGAAGGDIRATGYARWTPGMPAGGSALAAITLQLDAVATSLRVSARADRRLAVSGTLQARLDQARLSLRGALSVDQALFILPEETAPSLGADVVVTGSAGRGSAPAAQAGRPGAGTALESDLRVTLDLGRDFRVRGRGIDTRVAGELDLHSTLKAGAAPRLTGQVRTVGGRYQAYGQRLTVEQGVLRFTGAYDNPSLNILALRPNLTQRVGVQITGTALSPRVRLYSEPELPEAEKLAWLVLGRSASGGGAEAAVLQQAAMALLGGQNQSGGIAGRLGLDELSVSGASELGSGGAGAATVTLGKRLSSDFYVAYERSLAGTLGTFSIFYDLSKRFTLRARTGEKNAVDLIFTLDYD